MERKGDQVPGYLKFTVMIISSASRRIGILLLLVFLINSGIRTGAAVPGETGNHHTPGNEFREQIYRAYISGKMDRWKEIMEEMERRYRSTGNLELLYDLAEAEYGYIGWLISGKEKREARRMLERSEQRIELLLENNIKTARTYSILGAYFGYRVGLEPLRAPVYGPKSEEANQAALEAGPNEPQAWMERANIEYYKPAIFGGSKEAAVPLYEKAVRLYETDESRSHHYWLYLNCMTGLAMAYENTGSTGKAGDLYRRILRIEPDFLWVRDDLYPRFRKNHPGK